MRAAAREVADPGREPDQLGQPAPGDVLDLRGRGRAAAEVGVERRGEHRRGDARLEPGAVDERERARVRVRERARQHLVRDALDDGLEPDAAARQRHAVARALLVVEHDGGGQVARVAAEGGGALARQRDRARRLLRCAEARSFAVRDRRAALREDARGEDGRVARAADRHAADRHARGHLRDRQQRVHAAEAARGDRHADHGQLGVGGHDAGQRRRHAGAADQHADAAQGRALGVGRDLLGVAVRRDHAHLVARARARRARLQAFSMTGRSDSDPMRIPTSGPSDSRPGISSSISAGEGVGLGMSDTCFLLGCAQRDVAAHLLAVEFDLERAGHGPLAGEMERRRGRRDTQDAAAGDDEAAVAQRRAGVLHAHAGERLGALDALDRLTGARRLRVARRRQHERHGRVVAHVRARRRPGAPCAIAASAAARSPSIRATSAWVSGSPKRTLYSSTRGPSAVSMSPA